MPDDRPHFQRPNDRPPYGGQRPNDRPPFAAQRPFRPSPRVETPAAPLLHSLRLRDGEREIEVSGSPVFVRQALDDLPSLLARLHGEASGRPHRIDLPAPPAAEPPPQAGVRAEQTPRNGSAAKNGIDERVLAILEQASRPLAVAAIRKRLGGSATPQQVRRILERNAGRVAVTDDRPATYRMR